MTKKDSVEPENNENTDKSDNAYDTYIETEDLRKILDAHRKFKDAQNVLDNLRLQCRVLELEYNAIMKDVKAKYDLNESDRFDTVTGRVINPEQEGEE